MTRLRRSAPGRETTIRGGGCFRRHNARTDFRARLPAVLPAPRRRRIQCGRSSSRKYVVTKEPSNVRRKPGRGLWPADSSVASAASTLPGVIAESSGAAFQMKRPSSTTPARSPGTKRSAPAGRSKTSSVTQPSTSVAPITAPRTTRARVSSQTRIARSWRARSYASGSSFSGFVRNSGTTR